MTNLIEFCACCDQPVMLVVDSTYQPTSGDPISCYLCPPCVTSLKAGDIELKNLLETKLLMRRVCA